MLLSLFSGDLAVFDLIRKQEQDRGEEEWWAGDTLLLHPPLSIKEVGRGGEVVRVSGWIEMDVPFQSVVWGNQSSQFHGWTGLVVHHF